MGSKYIIFFLVVGIFVAIVWSMAAFLPFDIPSYYFYLEDGE